MLSWNATRTSSVSGASMAASASGEKKPLPVPNTTFFGLSWSGTILAIGGPALAMMVVVPWAA